MNMPGRIWSSLVATSWLLHSVHSQHHSMQPASFTGGIQQRPFALPSSSINPLNHSYISSWATIGDSYAAGIGTGSRTQYACSHYDGGYPHLIAADERFGVNPNRTTQFLACSGATSSDALAKQVPHLNNNLDLLLISAGGNDVLLSDVLDGCIFQWRRGGSDKCEQALNQSNALIEQQLGHNLEALLDAALVRMKPGNSSRIFWPGYAQFFGLSESCSNMTWSVWPSMADGDKQRLTLERRRKMNEMVDKTNTQIRTVIDKTNRRLGRKAVWYVDWDWTFGQAGGRFCEKGIVEPDPMRPGLLFFEWNTLDDGDDPSIIMRPSDPVPRGSFEGDIAKWTLETLDEHPDWEFGPPGTRPVALRDDSTFASLELHDSLVRAQLGLDDVLFWLIPDSWRRVFHPRALGHRIIADMILHDMDVHQAEVLGVDLPRGTS